jgi:uncharacterized protein RhaS with RHS repeats
VIHYYFQDRLRSTDIITDAQGNIQKESDYYPYGGEIPISGSDSNHYKFTGKNGIQRVGWITSALGTMQAAWAGS